MTIEVLKNRCSRVSFRWIAVIREFGMDCIMEGKFTLNTSNGELFNHKTRRVIRVSLLSTRNLRRRVFELRYNRLVNCVEHGLLHGVWRWAD